MQMNSLLHKVDQARTKYPEVLRTIKACGRIYAGGVLCAKVHKSPDVLATAAVYTEATNKSELRELGRGAMAVKSENFLLGPQMAEAPELFRRGQPGAGKTAGETQAPLTTEDRRTGPDASLTEDSWNGKGSSDGAGPPVDLRLPYSQVARIKILGVIFEKDLQFSDHFERTLARVKVRMAILARVAGCSWGLETRLLGATGLALAMSLLLYGWAAAGSGLSEKHIRQLDAPAVFWALALQHAR